MLSLVLGGARSGKSELAELQAGIVADRVSSEMTYVATGQATDGEMAIKIDQHRRRRPGSWGTVEIGEGGDLAKVILNLPGTLLVDSLGTWLVGFEDFQIDTNRLTTALRLRKGDTIIVSDEVGMGVHPSYEVGRLFRDALGDLNRAVASVATEVWLVVVGLPMRFGGPAT